VVTVSAGRRDGLLQMRVCDDGPDLPAGWGMEVCKGISLRNTRRRLQQPYGARQRLDIRNIEGGGAVATLLLPLRLNGDAGYG